MVNSYLMVSGFPLISAYFPLLISNSLKNKVKLWEQAVKHNLWLLLKLEFSLASGTRKSSIKHLPTINLFPMQRNFFYEIHCNFDFIWLYKQICQGNLLISYQLILLFYFKEKSGKIQTLLFLLAKVAWHRQTTTVLK